MNRIIPTLLRARLGAVSAAANAAQPSRKLNVLLIVVDDLRDTLGCYGNGAVKTPHLDRPAARGGRFDRAYAQNPVCNSRRTSVLTGLRPDRTVVTDNRTLLRDQRPDVATLPQLLEDHGCSFRRFWRIADIVPPPVDQHGVARLAPASRWQRRYRFKNGDFRRRLGVRALRQRSSSPADSGDASELRVECRDHARERLV
ncbi:MAG: sulfatase-like hydrolase/transferase, partial [Phycisphaerales bacterium]|nr:sulfatase-like hydrolase/transferase [Phycisphaerales bacterium]